MFYDPSGLVRWGAVASNFVGILGNGAGMVVGGALLAAPEPTMLTKVAGGAVLAKSIYGWGASWYGLTRAFSDDNAYDIPQDYTTAPRALTCTAVGGCTDVGRGMADIADLGLDFASGRVSVDSTLRPKGAERLPMILDLEKPRSLPVSATFTPAQNRALDILQGLTAAQSVKGSSNQICK